jgi:hypothetical protein
MNACARGVGFRFVGDEIDLRKRRGVGFRFVGDDIDLRKPPVESFKLADTHDALALHNALRLVPRDLVRGRGHARQEESGAHPLALTNCATALFCHEHSSLIPLDG